MKTKNYFLILFLGINSLFFAQIPTGYYDSASGLTGAAQIKTSNYYYQWTHRQRLCGIVDRLQNY
jgi:hypothetical protein